MKRLHVACISLLAVSALADDSALKTVSTHQAVFTEPPRSVPTRFMPDGPLLGNGDAAVVMGGPAERLEFFIGKNDFWGRVLPGFTLTPQELADGNTRHAHTKNAGRLTLEIPALKGASYRLEQSFARAEVTSACAKSGLTVRTRSRVDAIANVLVTEISCEGGETDLFLRQQAGDQPVTINNPPTRAVLGREVAGGGRWYFHGEIAAPAVSAVIPSEAELRAVAASLPAAGERFDGTTTWRALENTPAVSTAVAVSAWIKLDDGVTDQGVYYIVSSGEWNQAYSLGVTVGRRLRWSVNGGVLELDQPLEKNRWLHVAGILSERGMAIYVNGKLAANRPASGAVGRTEDLLWGRRDADPLPGCRKVAWATRVWGGEVQPVEQNGFRVRLSPGKPVTVATAIVSDLEEQDCVAAAQELPLEWTPAKLAELEKIHRQWWADFWAKSFIEIPDKEIEKRWYAALYAVAACNREGKIPAGLWGWATADVSAWCGAYTLNYNWEAPYFIVFAANHPELARNTWPVVLDFVPKSRELARRRGFKGIYFPTGIAPWGWHFGKGTNQEFPDFADFAQRSNAAYLTVNFISYWEMTRDETFLRDTAYPFLRGVAEFWEDYLKLEPGPDGQPRYVIYHDAIHEEYSGSLRVPESQDMNPLVSLALVKQLFRELVAMSETLGVDADQRAEWRGIADRISRFPTQTRDGKTIFRYTEKGRGWYGSNTLGIQHIYPGNGIGLDSDPALLDIARNTIDAMNRWSDDNGSSTWYPACARVGYDPQTILGRLRRECDTRSMPNLLLSYGGGGMENCGTFAVVTEMLMQSHEGVLRFFPCWPRDQDAKFGNLRAVGAFRVSAELKGGVVSGVKIVSERGRDLTVLNPWPGKAVRVIRNGLPSDVSAIAGKATAEALAKEGDRFTLKTAINESIALDPQ